MPSAALVKQLRDATGIGMMECKKALLECDGDFEKARDWLRVKSGSKAEKLSERAAAEGRISYAAWGKTGALLEIVCETDFVARDDNLVAFSDACALALAKNPSSTDNGDIGQLILADGKNCKESLQELVMKMEKTSISAGCALFGRAVKCGTISTPAGKSAQWPMWKAAMKNWGVIYVCTSPPCVRFMSRKKMSPPRSGKKKN